MIHRNKICTFSTIQPTSSLLVVIFYLLWVDNFGLGDHALCALHTNWFYYCIRRSNMTNENKNITFSCSMWTWVVILNVQELYYECWIWGKIQWLQEECVQRFVEIIVKCDQRHSIVLLSLKIKYDLHFHVVCDMSSESQCSRTY